MLEIWMWNICQGNETVWTEAKIYVELYNDEQC